MVYCQLLVSAFARARYTTVTVAKKASGALDWGKELFLLEEDDLLASDMCLRFQVMGVRKWGQDVVLGQVRRTEVSLPS